MLYTGAPLCFTRDLPHGASMRATASLVAVAGLIVGTLALTGCMSGPVFNGITKVQVRHIGSSEGLTETEFDAKTQKKLIECLANGTREVTEVETARELLQTTYLLVITDRAGDRNFELYTARNLKGNKGKYYANTCIFPIIRDAN